MRSYFRLGRHRMIKSIGTLASEGFVKWLFSNVTNLPAISAGRFTRLAAHFAKQRCLVSPLWRLELQCEGRHPQRAGIAPPQVASDGLSGATSDGETFAFISAPAGVVGGVPLTRARNPWAMPEAST